MTPSQYEWVQARDRLVRAVAALGFPAELGDLCARQLGSPKAIDRLTSYVHQEKPRSEEILVDEMLAIYEQTKTWVGEEGIRGGAMEVQYVAEQRGEGRLIMKSRKLMMIVALSMAMMMIITAAASEKMDDYGVVGFNLPVIEEADGVEGLFLPYPIGPIDEDNHVLSFFYGTIFGQTTSKEWQVKVATTTS